MGCLAVAYLSIIETLRRKEFYVVLVLIISLAVWLHLIDISESSTGRFAKDIVMQVVWLASFALAVPLAARQIPQDVESKTVYVILARPIPRWQYVLGRVIGASGASCLCLIGLFLVLVVMLFSKGDAALADAMLWQALVLQLAALFMVCSLAVFFSSFSTTAGAVAFSFMALFIMRYGAKSLADIIQGISGIGRHGIWWLYLIMPHFEFFNVTQRFVHGWGPLPSWMFLCIVGYGIVYALSLIAGCSLIFRRRWL